MFNTQALLRGFGYTEQKRVLFYPGCDVNSAYLSYRWYDVQIFGDDHPKKREERMAFWKSFQRTLPKKRYVPLAATTRARVFALNPRATGGYEKTGILFFENQSKTLDRIRRAGLSISCYVSLDDRCRNAFEGGQDECLCKMQFFKKVLSNMNPYGLRFIGTHSPHTKIHNLMVGGKVGDKDEVKIGGTRYTIILERDMVWGVPDACEVRIQKNEIQDPMYLFTEDEIWRARCRASSVGKNERLV